MVNKYNFRTDSIISNLQNSGIIVNVDRNPDKNSINRIQRLIEEKKLIKELIS